MDSMTFDEAIQLDAAIAEFDNLLTKEEIMEYEAWLDHMNEIYGNRED